MGVDFFPCDYCGESICDCGDYVSCEGKHCGRHWCSDECAVKDGFKYDEDDEDNSTCSYCRQEEAEDGVLLAFLLKKCKLTREEVLQEWRETKKKKEKNRG